MGGGNLSTSHILSLSLILSHHCVLLLRFTLHPFEKMSDTDNGVLGYIEPLTQFTRDSIRLVKRCTKPDRKGECVRPRSGLSTIGCCAP